MVTGPSAVPQTTPEDPLAYLPCSTIEHYSKGAIIYEHGERCDNLYLVLSGAVKVTRIVENGKQLLLDIYRTDEFFGETSLLNLSVNAEQAVSHQKTTLMAWPIAAIEELILTRPKLAVALLQSFGQRLLALTQRMESLFFDPLDRRLARSLIRFSERLGAPQPDGGLMMQPLTHELLAQYVGSSREVVNCHMTKFRRLGYLKYSRKSLVLYRDVLTSWLNQERVN